MKNYLKKFGYYALVAFTVIGLSASCSDDDPIDDDNQDELVLEGELTTEKTLEAGKTYELIGGYQVKAGGKLIIQEGVTILATRTLDGQPDYIIVEQGGTITANGTKDKPIVMTSTRQAPGAWGGVVRLLLTLQEVQVYRR